MTDYTTLKPIPTWKESIARDYPYPLDRPDQEYMQQEIDALRTRVAELEKDAARYRWLREQPALDLKSDGSTWTNAEGKFVASHRLCAGHTAYSPYSTLDEIIDNAMAKEQPCKT